MIITISSWIGSQEERLKMAITKAEPYSNILPLPGQHHLVFFGDL
jgi:hypothetical protein